VKEMTANGNQYRLVFVANNSRSECIPSRFACTISFITGNIIIEYKRNGSSYAVSINVMFSLRNKTSVRFIQHEAKMNE